MSPVADSIPRRPAKHPRRTTISLHDSFLNSSNSCSFTNRHGSCTNSLPPFADSSSDSFLQSSSSANSSTTSSSSDASSTCFLHPPLQPNLWRQLPEELVERILAFLPVSCLFRFRVVCKRWRSLAFSHYFLELRAQLSAMAAAAPHFLALSARSRRDLLSAYDPISNRWYAFPINFLPAVAYPAAAAKGLICFVSVNFRTGYSTLLVCNPLTRRWKELPAMLYRRVPFLISMAVDRTARTYKILVAGGSEESMTASRHFVRRSVETTEMYDSATGNWILCGSLPRNEEISRSAVEFAGHHMCLSRGSGSGLLAFSLQTQVWFKVQTAKIPGYSKSRHMVKCGGSIVIVGRALRQYVLGLYIWSLDPQTMSWKEVGKMPPAICDQFFSSPGECFYCTAQGHLIFFSRYFCTQGLVYNILQNSWQQLSGCPLLTNPQLLAFDPGLDPVD